ncbi:MAG TPA: hypothetical protein VHX61_01665 [Rhizomicrobium sp.]|jgi:hypothetical protein|nr:hypothetical protein [Rhizomicrobium sp.]
MSVDGIFSVRPTTLSSCAASEIDRSMAIVVEAAENLNRANFPLKSKAKKFDGLAVGFRPSAEKRLRIKISALRCVETIEWE